MSVPESPKLVIDEFKGLVAEDLGKSFDSPKKLAEHGKTLDTGSDARPQILVDQQKILVAYAFFKDTQWNAQVNLIRSEDGGESFSTPLPLIQMRRRARIGERAIEAILGIDQITIAAWHGAAVHRQPESGWRCARS